jgi:hypothetical protein
MKENVLKKEFAKKDVQRLRNLVQGKYGEKTHSSVGFSKTEEFHSEGDIWESDGRTWTIKNGIKQNVTKLDKAKKAHSMPLLCPNCSKVMNGKHDKSFYNIHKKCYNCVVEFETELKISGKWEEYEKNIHNDEIDNKIKEFKLWVKDRLDQSNDSFISEDGDIEKWVGKIDESKVSEHVESVIEYLNNLKR